MSQNVQLLYSEVSSLPLPTLCLSPVLPSHMLSLIFTTHLSPLTPSLPCPYIQTSGEVINCTSESEDGHHCTKITSLVLLDEVSNEAITELSAL